MRSYFSAPLLLALLALASPSAQAASPYDEDLRALASELRTVMIRADQPAY
nr:hypothetical protein [Pseudomonas luteola]